MVDYLSLVKKHYQIKERDLESYSVIKKKGMNFHISGYEVKDVGYINAMGNETLLLELYDTQLAAADLSALNNVKSNFAHLPDHDLGTHWYDHLKLAPSLAKKGKKLSYDYQTLCNNYFLAYLSLLSSAPSCDRLAKQAKVREYTNGLLTNGGPSTDQFKKMIGDEATKDLFTRFIFSLDC